MSARGHTPAGWFVARVPLLPFDELDRWRAGGLDAILRRPEVREAVFLASPRVAASMDAVPPPAALLRYLLRAIGRATPFGLFATTTHGTIGDRTRLPVPSVAAVERRTRLDAGYVHALSQRLGGAQDAVRFRPNDTLYRLGDELRYAEERSGEAGRREHQLVAAAATPPLMAVLERASGGARRVDLVDGLVGAGHERGAAAGFVDELVNAQILIGDAAPPVSGGDGLTYLLHRLPPGKDRAALASAQDELARLDAAGAGQAPAAYEPLVRSLEPLPVEPDLDRLVHVDAHRPAPASLAATVVAEIEAGIDVLIRTRRRRDDPGLARFRVGFEERYGERWVPLLEALDDGAGVGYLPPPEALAEPAPLIAGLRLGDPAADPSHVWGRREHHLLGLLHGAWSTRAGEVVLSDADVEELTVADASPLPDAFAAFASVAAASDAALDRGDFQMFLSGTAGPSGARLVARSCLFEPELEASVRDHLRAEEAARPEAVFAEVSYCPEPRTANILHRPELRDAEIPIGGTPGSGNLVKLADLLVTVDGGRIRMFSAELGREVVPRTTTAHDFHAADALGVYRFLGALQGEGTAAVTGWDWAPLSGAPYLPRLRYGRVVLAKRRWRLTAAELEALLAGSGDLTGRVERLRANRGLPHVGYLLGPDPLLVDFGNPEACAAALEPFAGRPHLDVEEVFPPPGEMAARGAAGGEYVHELVVPFHRAAPAPPPRLRPPRPGAVRRDFPPGSEWLYVKAYGDPARADRLLTGPVAEVVRQGGADRWFFVRYADPAPHVRVRFGGPPAALRDRCRPLLEELLAGELEAGRLHGVRIDVYRREVDRYGGPKAIETAEQVFHVDSEAVLALLPHVGGDAGRELRWQCGLIGMHQTLGAFGLDAATRRLLVARVRGSLEREMGVDRRGRAEILGRLRPHRRRLLALLDGEPTDDPFPAEPLALLAGRAAELAELATTWHGLAAAGDLTAPLDEIAWSFVHMFLNRLLRGAPRRQELVLTTFLDRLYDSQAARGSQQVG